MTEIPVQNDIIIIIIIYILALPIPGKKRQRRFSQTKERNGYYGAH